MTTRKLYKNGEATRAKIFAFIETFWQDHYHSPTIREIVAGCELHSTCNVAHHADVLAAQGKLLVDRTPGEARAFMPTWVKIALDEFAGPGSELRESTRHFNEREIDNS